MKKKDIIFILVVGIVIGSVFAGYGAYAATSYALSSDNVEYKDNSGLGVTNVQAAIDGTCTKIDNRLDTLESNIMTIDKVYPVGSIYISTSLSTTDQVKSVFGGTWETYGTGKVLKGTTGTAGTTGGSNAVKLTTENLPSHTHSYTPSGTVSSTFTGTAATSGNNSATPTTKFAGTRALTESAGAHAHKPYEDTGSFARYTGAAKETFSGTLSGTGAVLVYGTGAATVSTTGTAGAHQHYYTPAGTVTLSTTTHTHSVTAKGTVASTFTGKTLSTAGAGYDSSTITGVNVEDEYITVYMYRRTA